MVTHPAADQLFAVPLQTPTAKQVITQVIAFLTQGVSRLRAHGMGYVMAAGGKYARYGYATCRHIRENLQDDAEIEVWVGSDERLEAAHWGIPGVFTQRAAVPGGWPLKSQAVRNSSFKHVVFLDADCLPMRRAEELIALPEYQETGTLFFPDIKDNRKSDWVFLSLGLKIGSVPEMEAGQFLIDRIRHTLGIELACYFNAHPEFFYKHLHGDKDLWALALARLGVPFSVAPPCANHTWGLRHFLPDGSVGFDHLIHAKSVAHYTDYQKPKPYDGEYAQAIASYLEEYADLPPLR